MNMMIISHPGYTVVESELAIDITESTIKVNSH